MNQYEGAAARRLASVSVAGPVPIGEGHEDLDSLREKIMRGQAFLRVVEYPWGVEFDVSEVGSKQ